jgi:Fic family protein
MKIPVPPPSFDELMERLIKSKEPAAAITEKMRRILFSEADTEYRGKYIHWDKLRHLTPPEDLISEEWWLAIDRARKSLRKKLVFTSKNGSPFYYVNTGLLHKQLHQIDQNAGGIIQAPEPVTNEGTRDRHLISSLIAEAITSSQLEGAATTLSVAKDMLRSGRRPLDVGEQMILNNYNAMLFIRDIRDEPLTPAIILELQRIVTDKALEKPEACGAWRTANDNIAVYDNRDGMVLHVPPQAHEIEERINRLCQFANADNNEEFFHPVVRAILLHFMLAYDHPFVDGNGRAARALFYWYMAKSGYWLIEFVSISKILKQAPAQYARSFLYTETDANDTTYFLTEQCRVILDAIKALHLYLRVKVDEQHGFEALLRGKASQIQRFNHRQLALLTHAQKHPGQVYTMQSHKMSHGITYETARRDLTTLNELNLLDKVKRSKSFVFVAPQNLEQRLKRLLVGTEKAEP